MRAGTACATPRTRAARPRPTAARASIARPAPAPSRGAATAAAAGKRAGRAGSSSTQASGSFTSGSSSGSTSSSGSGGCAAFGASCQGTNCCDAYDADAGTGYVVWMALPARPARRREASASSRPIAARGWPASAEFVISRFIACPTMSLRDDALLQRPRLRPGQPDLPAPRWRLVWWPALRRALQLLVDGHVRHRLDLRRLRRVLRYCRVSARG